MKQKKHILWIGVTGVMIILTLVNLSGCTGNQDGNQTTNKNLNMLLGTWVGTLQMPSFDARSNASMSQITLTSDQVEIILTNEERTFSMNYTYSTNGDSLILTPMMTNRNGFPGRQPFNGSMPPNGTRPPGNGTWSPNGTQPPGIGSWLPNGTAPMNGTIPFNGTRPLGDNRQSMTVTFLYTLDEQARVLYLNNVPFTKI